jgi:hypothetical protein
VSASGVASATRRQEQSIELRLGRREQVPARVLSAEEDAYVESPPSRRRPCQPTLDASERLTLPGPIHPETRQPQGPGRALEHAERPASPGSGRPDQDSAGAESTESPRQVERHEGVRRANRDRPYLWGHPSARPGAGPHRPPPGRRSEGWSCKGRVGRGGSRGPAGCGRRARDESEYECSREVHARHPRCPVTASCSPKCGRVPGYCSPRWRAMTIRCTSFVPSPISRIF